MILPPLKGPIKILLSLFTYKAHILWVKDLIPIKKTSPSKPSLKHSLKQSCGFKFSSFRFEKEVGFEKEGIYFKAKIYIN